MQALLLGGVGGAFPGLMGTLMRQSYRVMPAPAGLEGKLLRLHKDAPHVQSTQDQLAAFREHFMPLFQQHELLQHELIRIEEGVPALLSALLETSPCLKLMSKRRVNLPHAQQIIVPSQRAGHL